MNVKSYLILLIISSGLFGLQAQSIPLSQKEIRYHESIDSIKLLNKLAEIDAQVRLEINQNTSRSEISHPLFEWPLRQASGFEDFEVYSIFNFVDHDTSNVKRDYLGGNRTYNGHDGTDIVLAPFDWIKMAENQVEIVAAADGVITKKEDGNFDQNCTWEGAGRWNGVTITHIDGSRSIYGHMKSGSVTQKDTGEIVIAGEYLGLVGSSGVSTLPHLHFEVKDAGGNLIDPFMGPNNLLNDDTWWADQLPYFDSGVNKLMTSTQNFVNNPCPQLATIFEEEVFEPDDTISFSLHLRTNLINNISALRVFEPDGDLSPILNTDYQSGIIFSNQLDLFWKRTMPSDAEKGKWIFQAQYAIPGELATIYQKEFWVPETCFNGNLDLVGLHLSDGYYRATTVITSDANVPNGIHIVYDAENYTILEPGFRALPGSIFEVKTKGCN